MAEPAMQADAYFFDIDGTLVVTRDLVHWNALHQAMLDVYGVDTTIEGLSYHGKTDVAILRAALNRCGISDLQFDERLASALAVVRREVAAQAEHIMADVCPGIPELLSEIRYQGRLLGVASGNLESVGWSKISMAKLREFFTVGSFGDSCELRKMIFENAVRASKQLLGSAATVCFIGDTPDDIHAARAVGARVIAVGTGTFGSYELAVLNPDQCCTDCTELLGRLR
jgi:phosphoglycolate phosphatase